MTHETLVVELVKAPPQASLLHYPVLVDNNPNTAMLDTGASHSFITRTLVTDLKLSTIRLGTSLTATDFGGARAVITETVTAALTLAKSAKKWSFYVCKHAPAPVVLGLDAVLRWPLFLNPRDMCLHFVPEQPGQHALTSQRGQSAVCSGDRGSFVLWPAPSSLTTSSYAIFDHNELRSPPEESGFLEDSPPPIEEEAQRLLPVFPQLLSHDATSFTLARNSSVTASGFEELSKLKDFIDRLSPSFRELVSQFSLLFQPPDRDPPNRSVKHYIFVSPDSVPAARPAYPLPHLKKEAMKTQMRELIDKEWVVPSSSPWASPILLVPKDQGTNLRLCIDFRDLNALTKKDRFPLPRIDVLLHRAAKARVFSKIDLASGFHQIEVYQPHRELTAFILPETIDGHSLWEWKVMPFGLVNAPSTFQRAMSVALRGCENFSVVYIDDILVFSEDEAQHHEHLRSVFDALQSSSYHVRLQKCSFFASEVPFLGHVLSTDGIKADTSRFNLADAFPTPFLTAKQVRSFLGLVMWYRTFIPHVATLAAPLFPLTSPKKQIAWSEVAEAAVTELKRALSSTPVLARYDRDLETRVTTDASLVGLGAVLEQQHGDQWRPVAFWSRKLIDAETRYSATELEWLAVVEAVTRVWWHQLEDIPFTLRSDHAALSRKLSKSAHDPPISARQARWIERLMPYQITFEYIPGKDNIVSDALSRYPALKTYSFTLSLVSPTSLGVLGRIAFVARGDPVYQQLLDRVRRKNETTGATGHVDQSVFEHDTLILEEGAKSTALAQPRRLRPELDPGFHIDTRKRLPTEDNPRGGPTPRTTVPLTREEWEGFFPSAPRSEVGHELDTRPRSEVDQPRTASRTTRPRIEVDPRVTTGRSTRHRRNDGSRSGEQPRAAVDPSPLVDRADDQPQPLRQRPRVTIDRTGRLRRPPDNEIQLFQTFPPLPQYQQDQWGIPSPSPEDHPATGETESPNEDEPSHEALSRGGAKRYDDPANLTIENGLLCSHKGQILLPNNDELRTWCISQAHDSTLAGHFGVTKTLEKVRRQWIWPGVA